MKKRALAILLALAMMVTFMPAMAFADEPAPAPAGNEEQSYHDYVVEQALIQQLDIVKAISAFLCQYNDTVDKWQLLADLLHDRVNQDIDFYQENVINDPELMYSAIRYYSAALRSYPSVMANDVKSAIEKAIENDPVLQGAWKQVKESYNELDRLVFEATKLHFEDMTPEQAKAQLEKLNKDLKEKTDAFDKAVKDFVTTFIAKQQAGFEELKTKAEGDPILSAAIAQLTEVYGMLDAGFKEVTGLNFADLNEDLVKEAIDKVNEQIKKAAADFDKEAKAAVESFIMDQAKNLRYFLDHADEWIAEYAQTMNELAKAKSAEAYQKAMEKSMEAYQEALELAEQLYNIGLTQKEIIEQLYAEGGTDAIYAAIGEQLDELDAMFVEAQEKMATILTNQFQALKNQSAFVKSEVTKFFELTGLGAHINNVVDIVSDMVEQMTLVAAEYQAVIGQMNDAVKAKLQSQFNEVLDKFNGVVEKYQAFAKQIEKFVDVAKLHDVEALLDLFEEDFGIDVDALADKVVEDFMTIMESEEVQALLEKITEVVTRIENTALDIFAYGTALASGEEAPYTSALFENMLLEFENGDLKAEIESLESDIRDLQAVNKSLIINNNNLTEENKALKEETKKDDKAYQTLVSNVKNSRKVVKNKVVLKSKATKNVKTRKIVIKWNKWTSKKGKITKYQVYYKAKGKSAVKKYVKKSKTKYTTKKLKKGTTYTVKVRAVYKLPYKNASGETKYLTYYSKWSKAKKVTINK